jgi:octaprenyl-diphosphate synthase
MKDLKYTIIEMVSGELEAIEAELAQNLNPYLDLVSEIAGHILFSGGKRLRPLLTVLSARICGYSGNYAKTLSIAVEYLHAATLLHDDLVDGALLRRGSPVAHTVWDIPTAVLVGDFLLARSLSIAAETGLPRIIKVIAGSTENMSQGEIHQLIRKGALDLSETEYMEIIQRKTAVLFQGACRVGAIIADAPESAESALSTYGFNLGITFQMTDDLLDYTMNAGVLGKSVGADLKEGKVTLPVIYSLEKASSKDRNVMEKIIKDKNFSMTDFKKLIELLNEYGGLTYTRDLAKHYVKKAKEALTVFKSSETKDILFMLADYAVARNE